MLGFGQAHALSLAPASPRSAEFVGALDGFTDGLTAAWSMSRRLLSSYEGPLFRIRRVSDNMESDIGFLASGDVDMDTYLAFATDGPPGMGQTWVRAIYDQTGNGNDALQAITYGQPVGVQGSSPNTIHGRAAMKLDGSSQSLSVDTLLTSLVAQYSCVMQSTGSTWNNYGAPLGNRTGNRLGLVHGGLASTDWWNDPFPQAMRKNSTSLVSPFDCAPIDQPAVYGVDCNVVTTDGTTQIGCVEDSFFLAASIAELAVWSGTADRTVFEADQKSYFGI